MRIPKMLRRCSRSTAIWLTEASAGKPIALRHGYGKTTKRRRATTFRSSSTVYCDHIISPNDDLGDIGRRTHLSVPFATAFFADDNEDESGSTDNSHVKPPDAICPSPSAKSPPSRNHHRSAEDERRSRRKRAQQRRRISAAFNCTRLTSSSSTDPRWRRSLSRRKKWKSTVAAFLRKRLFHVDRKQYYCSCCRRESKKCSRRASAKSSPSLLEPPPPDTTSNQLTVPSSDDHHTLYSELIMEHRHKIRPVQLFVPSSHNPNVLRLNKSALNAVLGHASIANRKIVVISVAGAYRKGKSFLLNFFLEYLYIIQYAQKNDLENMDWLQDEAQLEGFHYRAGPKRDTSGIWMWAEPIMIDAANGERYAVILMDTQGCFEQGPSSPSAISTAATAATTTTSNNNSNLNGGMPNNNNNNNQTNNNNLLTNNSDNNNNSSVTSHLLNQNNGYAPLVLSTLLSCVQLYNFGEFIPEEAIAALQFFTEYGRLAADEAKQYGKPFQKLVMVIRDFKVSDEMSYGFEGGNRLLEKALQNFGHLTSHHVRQHVRQCFSDGVLCCLLPNPGPKVCDANASFRGHIKDMKPIFRDEIRRVVESLIGPNLMRPKVVNGREITVRKFMECVREYGKLFETPEVPTPRHILNANIQLSCVDYALEAKMAYCRGMDRVTRSSRMMAEKKLLEAHIKHGIKALNIYDRCPKIDSGDIRSQNLARLQESINHELERYKRLNEEKRVTTCASAMLACGDSALFGVGLGGAASGAVAATVVTLQMGVVSAGIVAIPVSLGALFGIWVYVTLKPTIRVCLGMERDP